MSWLRREDDDDDDQAGVLFEAGRRPGEKHWDELNEDQQAAWREFLDQSKPAI